MNRLFANYQSPICKAVKDASGNYPVIGHEERRVYLVIKTSFLSGSDYAYVREGDEITRVEGGFFGKYIHYTAVGVEMSPEPKEHPIWLTIIARNADGKLVRLDCHGGQMIVASRDLAGGFRINNYCTS